MNLGLNTYGTARMLHDDFDGTMSKLHELGYTSVEPMIFFDGAISCISAMSKRAMLRFWKLDGGIWSSSINAAKRIAAVRTLGFSVPSVQAFGDLDILLTRGLDEVISFLKNNGARYLVVSPMKKTIC